MLVGPHNGASNKHLLGHLESVLLYAFPQLPQLPPDPALLPPGFFGENAKFWAVELPSDLLVHSCFSLTSASNELMRLCLLRWQDERLLPAFRRH